MALETTAVAAAVVTGASTASVLLLELATAVSTQTLVVVGTTGATHAGVVGVGATHSLMLLLLVGVGAGCGDPPSDHETWMTPISWEAKKEKREGDMSSPP